MTTANIARILATNAGRPELSREARRQITGLFRRTAPIDEALDMAHAASQVALEAMRQAEIKNGTVGVTDYEIEAIFADDLRAQAERIQAALAGVRR